MNHLHRFLLKLFFFTGAAAVLYCLTLVLLANFGPDFVQKNVKYRRGVQGHTFSRLKEADTVKNVDVLIVGSSQAYRSFDPRIFTRHGIRVFNLGTSSQTAVQTEFLIRKYLDSLDPDLVIWEIWPNSFTSEGTESLADLVSNSENPLELDSVTVKVGTIIGYNTFLVSVLNSGFGIDKHFIEPAVIRRDRYISGGFVERNQRLQPKGDLTVPNTALSQTQLKSFEKALKFMTRRGVKVVLIDAPVTESLWGAYSNHAIFDSLFDSFVQRGLVEAYVNFNANRTVDMEDSLHFYDYDHLNQAGVIRFNEVLLDEQGLDLKTYLRGDSKGYNLSKTLE